MRFWGVGLLWLAVNVAFWGWWLQQTNDSTLWLYWVETIALFYQTTLLPTVFWRFVRKMKRPVEVAPPVEMRVAMITLCVPSSESLDVIEGQLVALGGVEYPHDSWILDEGASDEVRALAHRLINVVLRIKRPYMITPKGKAAGAGPRALSIYAPYIVLAAFPLVAIWLFDASAGSSVIRGYYWLALANALMGAAVLATTFGMDIRQVAAEHGAPRSAVRSRAVVVLGLACVLALLALSMAHFGHQAVHAMTAA